MAGQDNKNPGPKRVAFGNGVFVIVGEKGLIARTKDGKTWENNRTREDVGDVQCIEFNGKEFLLAHTDAKAKTSKMMKSADGLAWESVDWPVPRQIRFINGVLYSRAIHRRGSHVALMAARPGSRSPMRKVGTSRLTLMAPSSAVRHQRCHPRQSQPQVNERVWNLFHAWCVGVSHRSGFPAGFSR